jgi:hypothetical protein
MVSKLPMKTSEYYKTHPAARRKRLRQQKRYNTLPRAVAKRKELGRINARNHKNGRSRVGDGMDVSHENGGGTCLEKASTNRARNRAKK